MCKNPSAKLESTLIWLVRPDRHVSPPPNTFEVFVLQPHLHAVCSAHCPHTRTHFLINSHVCFCCCTSKQNRKVRAHSDIFRIWFSCSVWILTVFTHVRLWHVLRRNVYGNSSVLGDFELHCSRTRIKARSIQNAKAEICMNCEKFMLIRVTRRFWICHRQFERRVYCYSPKTIFCLEIGHFFSVVIRRWMADFFGTSAMDFWTENENFPDFQGIFANVFSITLSFRSFILVLKVGASNSFSSSITLFMMARNKTHSNVLH